MAIFTTDLPLNQYAIIVGIVFIIEIVVVVLTITYSSKVKETAETGMDEAVKKYKQDDPGNLITQLVDNLQWNLKVRQYYFSPFCTNSASL